MPAFCLPFRLLFVDFRPFGCLLSSLWLPCRARCSLRSPLNIRFEICGFGFLSFRLPFVFLFGCFLSISILLAAFCLPFRLLFVDFHPFGCLLSSLWLPCWARCSLRSPLNICFEIYGFGFLSFWLPFVFLFGPLFVDFRPFGCLLSSLWLPCWACCSLRSPLNIGFEIYGFGFLSFSAAFFLPFRLLFVDFRPFWLPFVFSLAALLGLLLPPQSLKYWF